jgi:hypothetical protein
MASLPEPVQGPYDEARVAPDIVIAGLEPIQLLEGGHGYHDLVVREGEEGLGVVKKDAGVKDEAFSGHAFSSIFDYEADNEFEDEYENEDENNQ